jgi:hypothetical protein
MRGKKRPLTFAEAQAAGCLSYHEAQKAYHIGYARWKEPRADRGFLPLGREHGTTRQEEQAELRARIEASAREEPHLNTAVRAKKLGCSVGTAQKVLAELGLIKLDDEWSIRMMGDSRSVFGKQAKGAPDVEVNFGEDGQPLPFALVLDRARRGELAQDLSDTGHKLDRPPDAKGASVVHYK